MVGGGGADLSGPFSFSEGVNVGYMYNHVTI